MRVDFYGYSKPVETMEEGQAILEAAEILKNEGAIDKWYRDGCPVDRVEDYIYS